MCVAALHRKTLPLAAALLLMSGGAAPAQAQVEKSTCDNCVRDRRTDEPSRGVIDITIARKNIAATREVRYADLDLGKDWGRYLLELRVRQAAREVCEEIDRRYPRGIFLPTAGDIYIPMAEAGECVNTAVGNVLATARDRAVASGESGATELAALR